MSHLKTPVGTDDHTRGDPQAAVVLVEYGDYQCPFCGEAEPAVEQLLQRFGDRICFAFRNFPLTDQHPQALAAAIVAEYAGGHGKFWEAHDALYANQDQLGQSLYEQLIQALGLSLDGLRDALQDGVLQAHVEKDFQGGVRSGVNGTPCFFLNGQRYDGAGGLQGLADQIQALLDR